MTTFDEIDRDFRRGRRRIVLAALLLAVLMSCAVVRAVHKLVNLIDSGQAARALGEQVQEFNEAAAGEVER